MFQELYQVLPEHLNHESVTQIDSLSYIKEYDTFVLEITTNVMIVKKRNGRPLFVITTFTNGIIFDSNLDTFTRISFDELQTADDFFNFCVQKDPYDLDLDLIRHIENIIKHVIKTFYDSKGNFK